MLARVAKHEHPRASIDWATAEVQGGALSVELAGEPNSEWAKRAQVVVERLERSGSAWGAVKITKAAVTVEAVPAGAEEDLRHLLDGAVQQANADFAPEADDDEGEASEADAAMTETFRSFAGEAPDDDER
jgi:hypothetical protein